MGKEEQTQVRTLRFRFKAGLTSEIARADAGLVRLGKLRQLGTQGQNSGLTLFVGCPLCLREIVELAVCAQFYLLLQQLA